MKIHKQSKARETKWSEAIERGYAPFTFCYMKWCICAYLLISIPVTPFRMGSSPLGVVRGGKGNYWPEWWGVGSRESGVGKCGIIDLDSIVPIPPETILLNYGKAVKLVTGFSTLNYDKKRSLGGCDAKKSDRSNCCWLEATSAIVC